MDYHQVLPVDYDLIGEFRILELLGSGGFANTYLALEHALGRRVAIKEYYPGDLATRKGAFEVQVKTPAQEQLFSWGRERFVREAKTLAKFRHPNIVRVFRVFEANDTAYIALEFVKGVDLERWLSRLGRLPTQAELDELIAPLLDALEMVHKGGMLHRDVKPANIYIREADQRPVLIDFGAARYAVGEYAGTTAAIVSRGYSPHEAYATDSRMQGPWTDIYGLAATIYRAVSGSPPLEATSRVLNDEFVPAAALPEACKNFRPEFLAAIDAGLALMPKARAQSIGDWRGQIFPGRAPPPSRDSASGSSSGVSSPGLTSGSSPVGALASTTPPGTSLPPRSSKPSTGPSRQPSTGDAAGPYPKSGPKLISAQPSGQFMSLALGLVLIVGGAAALIATQTGLTGPGSTGSVGESVSNTEQVLSQAAEATHEAERARQQAAEAVKAKEQRAEVEAERVRQQVAAAAKAKEAEEKQRAEAEAERVAREQQEKQQQQAAIDARSQVPTEDQRAHYLKQVQTALKAYNCYNGEINGSPADAISALKRLETSYEGQVRPINLTTATVGDYRDWLDWSNGLEKFSCPSEKIETDKTERKKVQKPKEPVQAKKATRPTKREARSAPTPPRQSGGGAVTGVGF